MRNVYRSRTMRRTFVALVAVVGTVESLATAADPVPPSGTVVESKVDRVTVYSDRARVTRTSQVAVKDGRQRIVVGGLPVQLDDGSVSAALAGRTTARILSIEVEPSYGKRATKKEAEALLAKRDQLKARQKELDDAMAAINAEETFLRQLSVKPKVDERGRPLPVTLEPAVWRSTLDFARDSFRAVRSRSRATQVELLKLAKEVAAVEAEIAKVRSYETEAVKQVVVEIAGERAETAELEVTYTLSGPFWRPAYDVRVLTSQGHVEVTTHAVVRQETGEDWKEARVQFSTASPAEGADLPTLLAWRLGDEQQYRVATAQGGTGRMDGGLAESKSAAPRSERRAVASMAPAAPEAAAVPMPAAPPSKQSQRWGGGRPQAAEADEDEAEEAMAMPDMEASYDDWDGGPGAGGIAQSGFGGIAGSGGYGVTGGVSGAAAGAKPAPPPPATIRAVSTGVWSLPPGRRFVFANRDADGLSWTGDRIFCPSPHRAAGGFDFVFDTDRRQTVLSDGRERKVKVGVAAFPAKLLYEVVAPLSNKAYLRATIQNDGRQPFLAGETLIFLDEEFVGRAFVDTVAPRGELALSLGADEDVKVERRVEQTAEAKGILGKKDRTVYSVRVDLRSFKKRTIEVLVREQFPLTWQKDEISIETLGSTPDPLPDKEGSDKSAGLLAWRFIVPGGGKVDLRHKYAVERPRDFEMSEQRGNR